MTGRRVLAATSFGVALGFGAGAALVADEAGRPDTPRANAATLSRDLAAVAPRRRIVFAVTPAPRRHRMRPRLGGLPAAGILVDASTGEVMWSRNAWQRRPIASLTKMMNALVALDRASPGRMIRVSGYAASVGGSVVGGLPAGGRMRVGSLLRGMMITSGNDAANALADGLGPGRGRYVARMNARARRMGLKCTRFVSPEGLGAGNRSCAHDLAVIARTVLAQPKLRSMVAREWDSIDRGRNGRKLIRNRNPLVRRHYRGITGIKTGHTGPAGWCLVSSASRRGKRLIAVMLGEDEQAWQSQRLLDAGFRALRR